MAWIRRIGNGEVPSAKGNFERIEKCASFGTHFLEILPMLPPRPIALGVVDHRRHMELVPNLIGTTKERGKLMVGRLRIEMIRHRDRQILTTSQ